MQSAKRARMGSAPHARGALEQARRGTVDGGISPACAGSTCLARRCRRWSWDQPRMRGEHMSRMVRLDAGRGSAPHARGARHGRHICRPEVGISPACAGSTPCRSRRRRRGRDQPRMRGEHQMPEFHFLFHAGSAPHARGALRLVRAYLSGAGISPACAGSTRSMQLKARASGDQPRMRGEHRRLFWS